MSKKLWNIGRKNKKIYRTGRSGCFSVYELSLIHILNTEEKARALVKQFLDSALTSRELLVSLIERVELTEEKEIIIKFRFHELEAIS